MQHIKLITQVIGSELNTQTLSQFRDIRAMDNEALHTIAESMEPST